MKLGLPSLLFLAVVAVEILACLALNDGRFAYILDDPYIHLALAENLAHGHYGLSPGSLAAPSSSALWPWLLAPFARFGFAEGLPLLLNTVASLATIGFLARFAEDWLGPDRGAMSAALTTAAFLAMNVPGVVFTGMEHSLQLTCAVALVYGVTRLPATAPPPWWLVAALVGGPLLRYESLAVTVPAVLLLAWEGHRRVAWATVAALGASLGGFSLWLHSMGLGWFPTSVVAKSRLVADAAAPTSLAVNALHSLETRQGAVLLVLGTLLFLHAARGAGRDRRLAIFGVAAVALHFAAGGFGFHRYEIYIVGTALLLLLHLHRARLVALVRAAPSVAVLAGLAAGAVAVGFPYVVALGTLPIASNNIYEQHHQMHRFVTDFHPATIAANDIGWISYGNDQPVVDLWGISSADVLARRNAATGVEWIDALAAEHGVEYAILYDLWFPELPATWIRVAEMSLSRRRIYPAAGTVVFWAVAPGSRERLVEKLRAFEPTLPDGVRLDFVD